MTDLVLLNRVKSFRGNSEVDRKEMDELIQLAKEYHGDHELPILNALFAGVLRAHHESGFIHLLLINRHQFTILLKCYQSWAHEPIQTQLLPIQIQTRLLVPAELYHAFERLLHESLQDYWDKHKLLTDGTVEVYFNNLPEGWTEDIMDEIDQLKKNPDNYSPSGGSKKVAA